MRYILLILIVFCSCLGLRAQAIVIEGNQTFSSLPANQIYVSPDASFSLVAPSGGSITISPTGGDKIITTDASKLTLVTLHTMDMNYLQTITPRKASTNISSLNSKDINISLDFYDGLGRLNQKLLVANSPQYKDVVAPFDYDDYGRQDVGYLPYVSLSSDGKFKSDWESAQLLFYVVGTSKDKIVNDPRPSSQTIFEASPISRPLYDYGFGYDWFANVKGITYQYFNNTNGSAINQEKIITWVLNSSGHPVRQTSNSTYTNSGYYTSGQIQIKSTKDEMGNEVREYVDPLGRVVLKKNYDSGSSSDLNNRDNWTQTYYIYDDFGNLRYVFQPELVYVVLQNDTYNPSTSDLNNFAFQYKYDASKRMISKRIPGSGWMEIIYDQWDRIALTQDAVQAEQNPKEYSFIKYDQLNRPIMTGVWKSNKTPDQLRIESKTFNFRYEEKGVEACHPTLGYTLNQSFPQNVNGNVSILESDVLTVTYYDDYLIQNQWGSNYMFYLELGYTSSSNNTRVLGQVTGSLTRVLNTSNMLKSVSYFDKKYRVIQTIIDHHKGGRDLISSTYNFVSQLEQTKRTHKADGFSDVVISERFEYDHAGRLLKHFHGTDTPNLILLAEHKYNELGEKVEKNLHNENSGTSYLQSIDYRYNIRGWLTSINNSDLNSDAGLTNDDNTDLFGFEIKYNTGLETGTGTAQYNGNIAETVWKGKQDNKLQAYGFSYDALNRLKNASYRHFANNWTTSTENNLYNENISNYDKNGNIRNFDRNGISGAIDDLVYTYQGNKLIKVEDATFSDEGFKNGINIASEYTYDSNGNLKADYNKGVGSIVYNHLNLPESVVVNGVEIDYIYDAIGTKLQKKVINGANVTITDYIGGFHYETQVGEVSALQFVQTSEGRIRRSGDLWVYEYDLKDHLGNTRITFRKGANNLAEVLQQDDYYPFGLTFNSPNITGDNKYLYNGKELQQETDWYDYGARMYDAALGRFFTQDRFAEKYYGLSPYQYAANNPIRYIDVNGDSIDVYDPSGNLVMTLDDGKEKVTGMYFQNSKTNKKGKTTYSNGVSFEYNDAELDREGAKNDGLKVRFADRDINDIMGQSGVDSKAAQDGPWSYIERESRPKGDEALLSDKKSSGKMDYLNYTKYGYLNIVRGPNGDRVAYNDYDFGNFLWGMGGKRLGFSYRTLQGASHLNNAVNSGSDNPGVPYRILDSNADQRAIRNGYYYGVKPQQSDPQE